MGGYASIDDITMHLRLFVFRCLHFWFYKEQENNRIHQISMDWPKESQCNAMSY